MKIAKKQVAAVPPCANVPDDLLARFRASESPESAVWLLSDPEAKRLVGVWLTFPTRWTAPKGKPPEDERLAWDWIWNGNEPDLKELAARSDLAHFATARKFEALRASRLIYPDGTISAWASAILKADVVGALKRAGIKLPRQNSSPTTDPPDPATQVAPHSRAEAVPASSPPPPARPRSSRSPR